MPNKNTTSIYIDETQEPDVIIRTYILFVQTARDVLTYVDAQLYREVNSSLTQMVVLQALSYHNGVMSPSDISSWTQTESHNVTTLIRRMQRDGLVTSERSRRNKRIVKVMCTDKGRQVLAQILPVAGKIVDRVMGSFGKDEAARLEKLLKTMRLNTCSGLEAVKGKTARAPSPR